MTKNDKNDQKNMTKKCQKNDSKKKKKKKKKKKERRGNKKKGVSERGGGAHKKNVFGKYQIYFISCGENISIFTRATHS